MSRSGRPSWLSGAITTRLADHGIGLLDASSRAFADAMHLTALLSAAVTLAALVIVLAWVPTTPARRAGLSPVHAVSA